MAFVLSGLLLLPIVAQPGARSLQLVAYTGQQPVGYTIDKVPKDWFVQSLDSRHLLLAPIDLKGTSQDVEEFDGKILVQLEVVRPALILPTRPGPQVTVNGLMGEIFTNADNDGSRTLFVKLPARRSVMMPCTKELEAQSKGVHDPNLIPCGTAMRNPYLSIQVDGKLGWTNAQIVKLASGIHVTKDSTLNQTI